MLYSNLLRRKKRILLVAIITVLGSLLFTTNTFAESIQSHSTEVTLAIGDVSKHTVTLENDKDYDIFVIPTLYKYYPKSEYLLELEPFEEFVIVDTDYITVPANSTVNIPFQIIGSKSLEPGTYYNLIAFEHTSTTEQDQDKIGASGALSHIVQLNLTKDSNQKLVTDDYGVEMQVVKRGVPFFKPAKLKITIFNNSPYTLNPKGEIQITKKSKDKEPEYIKVNTQREKLYPQDSLEQEYTVEKWYIEDILFGKTAHLRLENGLDYNVITKEIEIPGYKNEFIYIVASLTVIFLLARSIKVNDAKPEPEYAE